MGVGFLLLIIAALVVYISILDSNLKEKHSSELSDAKLQAYYDGMEHGWKSCAKEMGQEDFEIKITRE